MYKKILGGLTLAIGSATLAHAALPNITVSYTQPTGVVAATDTIEMWVHIGSDREIDTALGEPFGFDATDLPTTGWGYDFEASKWYRDEPFASYTGVSISAGYTCAPCDAFGYDFVEPYWNNPNAFLNAVTGWKLHTGDFLVGTFVPQGTVAPGTYVFPLIPMIQFNVQGLSASGVQLSEIIGIGGSNYQACTLETLGACGFTRTVAAVPEASAVVYSLFGLAVAAGITQRRRLRHKA